MNAHPDIVAVGASSGGIEALQSLLAALSDLDAIVLVVLHRPAHRTSSLREILVRELRMPVVIARHGELLHHGVCYIAEPSQHLMVGPGLRADLLPDHRYTTRNIDFAGPALQCTDHRRCAFRTARRRNARARGHQEGRWDCHGPEPGRSRISGNAAQRDQI
jgi:hypothetical protein